MPRYDQTFAILAERAVKAGVLNLQTLILRATSSGVSEAAVLRMLEDDLANDGPVFGAFMRSITDAATTSTMVAASQGELLGTISGSEELQRLAKLRGVGGSVIDAIESGDPEVADAYEAAVEDDVWEMHIATLVNTCHRCLPLHGQIKLRSEWRDLGLVPELLHDGWASSCKCRHVPVDQAETRKEAIAPLRRVKLDKGKRTARAITQADIDKAMAARDEAMKSEEGRKILRLLGQAKAE